MAKEEAKKAAAKKPAAASKAAEAKKAKAEKSAPVAKAAPGSEATPADYVPRLRKHYDEVVRPALIKQFDKIRVRTAVINHYDMRQNVTACRHHLAHRFPVIEDRDRTPDRFRKEWIKLLHVFSSLRFFPWRSAGPTRDQYNRVYEESGDFLPWRRGGTHSVAPRQRPWSGSPPAIFCPRPAKYSRLGATNHRWLR